MLPDTIVFEYPNELLDAPSLPRLPRRVECLLQAAATIGRRRGIDALMQGSALPLQNDTSLYDSPAGGSEPAIAPTVGDRQLWDAPESTSAPVRSIEIL